MRVPQSTRQKPKTSTHPGPASTGQVEYMGKLIRTGNSTCFRFESALFKSHPEFSGQVRARVIAPDRLLVTAEPLERQDRDPVIGSFLAFLTQDMLSNPQSIRLLDQGLSREIDSLVEGLAQNKDEELGPEPLI